MLEDGECGYCHAALVRPKTPEAPKIVNVTRVELHAPAVGDVAGGAIDAVSARMFGCASGCVSMGMTVGITGMVLAFVGYQLWIASLSMPSPAPTPSPIAVPAPRPVPHPVAPHPTPGGGNKNPRRR